MSNFCKTCRCVSDDEEYCSDKCRPREEEVPGCAFACNGACRTCGQPVVHVTMLPIVDGDVVSVAMNPELEHGGNIEIRPNKAGKLFAKETGPDPDQRKFIKHSIACVGRRPSSKADSMMPVNESRVARGEEQQRPKAWPEERAAMIQEAIEKLS